MEQKVLLVNPPIYDFTAYDFWLRPYGLLNVAGRIDIKKPFFFDFLGGDGKKNGRGFGLGKFKRSRVEKPKALEDVPRPYNRFGAPRELFIDYLRRNGPFDAALVGSGMTYWYLGVREVVDEIRRTHPKTTVILGGIYPTLCPAHASSLGADLTVAGSDLSPVERFLPLKKENCPPRWDLCGRVSSGAIKISRGCPYSCSYCASKRIDMNFTAKPLDLSLMEFLALARAGAEDVAFYDDALLHDFDNNLSPFLDRVSKQEGTCRFHTPNGLHLRHLTAGASRKLVSSGFRTFFLSLEAVDEKWHAENDRKADKALFETALENLLSGGARIEDIAAYLLTGHPGMDAEMVRETLLFLGSKKVRPRLSEFSPIPGTADGDLCSGRTDLDEPLNHNKMAWTIRFYGESVHQEIKELANRISKDLRSGT